MSVVQALANKEIEMNKEIKELLSKREIEYKLEIEKINLKLAILELRRIANNMYHQTVYKIDGNDLKNLTVLQLSKHYHDVSISLP